MGKPRQGRHIQAIKRPHCASASCAEDVAPDGAWKSYRSGCNKYAAPDGAGARTTRQRLGVRQPSGAFARQDATEKFSTPIPKRCHAPWKSGGGPPHSKTLRAARGPPVNALASWSAPALWRFRTAGRNGEILNALPKRCRRPWKSGGGPPQSKTLRATHGPR